MSHYNRHKPTAHDDSDDDPSNESFILYGTEFPEPTEKERRQGIEDPGKFQPVWNQQVTDEKGRRRFHGAFTGGFSAGYYNTVGSKEGWQPSTFVSSRSTRQEKRGARPEDFMDEEDLDEIANARKLVATEEFDLLGGTERELARRREMDKQAETQGGILGAQAFQDFVIPSKDPIGVKLLRKMGWKPGQGVGARISAAKRRKIAMPNSESESDDDYDGDITFAPRDSAIIVFTQKRDTFGLGFDPYKNVPDIAAIKRSRTDRATAQGSGQDPSYNKVGFGVGVLDDDDDDDVYDSVSSARYATELYDDFDNDDRITIGGRQKTSKDSSKSRHRDNRQSTKRTGHDGRLPISGFEHGKSDVLQEKWFAPPQVPAGFKPVHVFNEPGPVPEKAVKGEKDGRPDLSFEERGNLLGEKPIAQRSVFDYVSSKSKDNLDNLLSGITRPVSNIDKSRLNDIPRVDKKDALTALRGFLPFGEAPKKQARYRAYLEGQAGLLKDDGSPVTSMEIPEGLTYDEAHKELDDFCKAARIFRPISGMMSSRFTSASQPTTVGIQTGEGGLRTESQWKKEKDEREKLEKLRKEETPKTESQEAQAAAMKMFGQLTRTTKPFYPSRLVCKRFSVKNPHPDQQADDAAGRRTQAGAKQPLSKESVQTMMNNNNLDEFTTTADFSNDPLMQAVIPKPSERTQQEQSVSQIIEPTIATAKEVEDAPLDYERPSMDIFKAIFEDSDDDEDEDEPEPEPTPAAPDKVTASTSDSRKDDDQDDMIGPPLPPPPEEPKPVFRPMFTKRTHDRQIKEESISWRSAPVGPISFISSEEHVVEPFSKSSSSADKSRREHKRSRRDDSDRDEDSDDDRRSSSRSHHKKESKKKKRKSERSDSRERRHKKNKKRRRERSGSEIDQDEIAERLVYDDSLWVEKPSVAPINTHRSDTTRTRPKAYDMW